MLRPRLELVLLACSLGLFQCGGDDDDSSPAGDGDADADSDADGDGDGDGDADADGDADGDGDGDGDGDADGDGDGDADDPADDGMLNALPSTLTLERDEGGLFGFSTDVEVYVAEELEGPAPVVVFLHGFTLSGTQYESYARHLASHGFVTAVPESMADFGTDNVTYAARVGALLDLLLAENETEGSPLQDRVDPARIALTGHSLGGKIALLVAADDDRVAASIDLDPVDSVPQFAGDGYVSVAPERMDDISIPLAFVGAGRADEGGGLGGQACAPAEDDFAVYYEAAGLPKYSLEILEAGHNQFLDDPGCLQCGACVAGELPDDEVRTLARRALRSFYEATLRDDDRFLPWLRGQAGDDDVITFLFQE